MDGTINDLHARYVDYRSRLKESVEAARELEPGTWMPTGELPEFDASDFQSFWARVEQSPVLLRAWRRRLLPHGCALERQAISLSLEEALATSLGTKSNTPHGSRAA